MKDTLSFKGFGLDSTELLLDYSQNEFPVKIYSWNEEELIRAEKTSSFYGIVFEGKTRLHSESGSFDITDGMYFAASDYISLSGGKGLLIEYANYRSYFNIGGPVEKAGRLKYIDGCTDSLLIPPVKLGGPCLNALFFPGSIFQTQHTHPSYRIGLVLRGSGACITPQENIFLKPGIAFMIHEDGLHSFKTEEGETLTVVAFHPDSDYGPEDENHPMINRTIIDGTSAKEIKEILTN